MPLSRPADRIPHDHRVGTDRRRWTPLGPSQDGANQNGRANRPGGPRDLPPRILVEQRIDIRRILRPDNELRLGGSPGADIVGQSQRLADMVVQHGAALGIEIQTEPGGDIALHHSDRHRGPAVPG